MSVDHYTYRVTWSPEDQAHVGLCIEFTSLSWVAPTPEEALSGVRPWCGMWLKTLGRTVNPFLSRLLIASTAANSACGYHRNDIASLPWPRRNRE